MPDKRKKKDKTSKVPKPLTKKKLAAQARTAKRKALAAWSRAVRDRDGNKCVVCGKPEYLNAHHILNKHKFPQYMYEIDCGISLCPGHHQFGKFAAETNAVFFANWMLANRPKQWQWATDKINIELSLDVKT